MWPGVTQQSTTELSFDIRPEVTAPGPGGQCPCLLGASPSVSHSGEISGLGGPHTATWRNPKAPGPRRPRRPLQVRLFPRTIFLKETMVIHTEQPIKTSCTPADSVGTSTVPFLPSGPGRAEGPGDRATPPNLGYRTLHPRSAAPDAAIYKRADRGQVAYSVEPPFPHL